MEFRDKGVITFRHHTWLIGRASVPLPIGLRSSPHVSVRMLPLSPAQTQRSRPTHRAEAACIVPSAPELLNLKLSRPRQHHVAPLSHYPRVHGPARRALLEDFPHLTILTREDSA